MSSTYIIFNFFIVLFLILGISYKLLTATRHADKVKNNRLLEWYISTLEWSGRIVPPLLLLYLIYKPSMVGGQYSQALCFLVLVISVITLCYSLVKNRKNKFNALLYVRPTMAIIISGVVIFVLSLNQDKARLYLWNVAEEMLKDCYSNNQCPEHPSGWTDRSRATYGYTPEEGQYSHFMYYRVSPNSEGKNFSIFIHYGPDWDYFLNGGVDKNITERYVSP